MVCDLTNANQFNLGNSSLMSIDYRHNAGTTDMLNMKKTTM